MEGQHARLKTESRDQFSRTTSGIEEKANESSDEKNSKRTETAVRRANPRVRKKRHTNKIKETG